MTPLSHFEPWAASAAAHLPTAAYGRPHAVYGEPYARRSFTVPPERAALGALGITKSGLTSMILSGAGSTLLSIAPATGPAAPFVAAAGAVAMLGAEVARMFQGCGPTCIQATQYADEASTLIEQMVKAYWAAPAPRPKALQQRTLAEIAQAINYINQACGDPALGDAGKRCISERTVRGGTAPWCPTPDHRGCDYLTAYYDPIANDKDVAPDSGVFGDSASGTQSGSSAALLLALALVAGVLAVTL